MRIQHFLAGLCLLGSLAQADEQVLNLADAQGDWGLLAPFTHSARGPGYVYTSFVFDSLLWKDASGTLQPLLAQSWNYDADSRCYAFSMNTAARWHDGKPVTAEDAAFSFTYLQQHNYRFVDFSPVKSVAANQQELEVCLKQEHAPFLVNVAASMPVLPKHIYANISEPARFNQPQAATGSGPYRLAEYNKAKSFYRLERHTGYHLGTPKYAEVRIIRMSPHAALAAMQRGQVDLTSVSYELVDNFRQAGMGVLHNRSNHPLRLLFNHQDRFDAVELRQGLARLIDRPQLAQILYAQTAEVARLGYRQDVGDPLPESYALDPQAAAVQLKAGGWHVNASGQWLDGAGAPIRLSLLAQPDADLLARALAEQLQQHGIQVDIRLEQDVQLSERLRSGQYDLALLSASHEGDPDRFRLLMGGQQQRSDHFLANQELLRLLDQQMHTLDPNERNQLLLKAERLYNQELPSLPLLNPSNFAVYRAERVTPAFTKGGIAMGIPMPLNKLELFLRD
ncbi:MAG: ABC transporter substrate-binding protein [Thiopseudomonas sp.]